MNMEATDMQQNLRKEDVHQKEIPEGKKIYLSLPGIRCAACIAKVERQLMAIDGVFKAHVNLSRKRVEVTATSIPIEDLIDQLKFSGIEALALDASMLANLQDNEAKRLSIRLAVAGFAMMNVMLLSVANWSGAGGATRELFHLISAAIALPAALYSAQPFFKNAWAALRNWSINMDVPISLAIFLASFLSLFETLNGGEQVYFDAALSLTFFLLLGRYLDHVTRQSARSAAQDLSALQVHTADRVSDGLIERVATSTLKIDDIVQIATGMRVPVDGHLQDRPMMIDRSILNGETTPVLISAGEMVHAGEVNVGAMGQISVSTLGHNSTLQRLSELITSAENQRNTYTNLADRAARIYAPAVHILAALAFLSWLAISGDPRLAINIAIAVLIITCPCALGLAVPTVSVAAIGKLFTKGFLVKDGAALERLAQVNLCVFDKTGTLTMAVPQVAIANLSETEKSIALALAQGSYHPLSQALANALNKVTPATVEELEEVIGAGVQARYEGQMAKLGNGTWLKADFCGFGLKIGKRKPREIPVSETLRPGVQPMISGLKKSGLAVNILSGDRFENAEAIGKVLGISSIISEVDAEEKHAILTELSTVGHKVLMVGDGLNDTAALAAAYASIAPASALDASRNAADIVVLREDFGDLPSVISIARSAVRLSKQNFFIAACYNLVAVPLALLGLATPLMAAIAMSASSLTVLLNALRVKYVT
ncbi:MAG: heavy metal translocating P-type ATPase [Marinovum sp.]|nr:heavy metal translocating P-type ATPase [Marinovum sp.]